MMRLYSFEKLEVWKIAKSLTIKIYKLSSFFPSEENKLRFIEIAYGSLLEVLNILIICRELKFCDDSHMQEIRPQIEDFSNKLNALKKAIEK